MPLAIKLFAVADANQQNDVLLSMEFVDDAEISFSERITA